LRSVTAYFLAGLFVASSSSAPANAAQVIHIQLSSSLNACFIDNVRILCSEVGGKLQAMNVRSNSDIHLVGDPAVGYELVHSALESLQKAGYRPKVAFLTGTAFPAVTENCNLKLKPISVEMVLDDRESRAPHVGDVVVEFTVDVLGYTGDPVIVSSTDSWFDNEVIESARHWRFSSPPHSCRMRFPVHFRLKADEGSATTGSSDSGVLVPLSGH
jgi:TonB family protein